MSGELPLRASHRVFEPQLAGALAWLPAATLIVLLGPVARVLPPELAVLLAGCTLVAVALHVASPRVLPRAYPRLLPDGLRTTIYGVALVGFGSAAVAGALDLALPRCATGPFTTSELALGLAWLVAAALQPSWFRRSLALEYLWPSSPRGYEARWVAKLVLPVVALGLVVAGHRVLEPSLWGAGRQARELLREIAIQPDEAAIRRLLRDESQRLSEPEQQRIAAAMLEHTRCDEELLQRALGVAQAELAEQLELQRGLRRHLIQARLAEGSR